MAVAPKQNALQILARLVPLNTLDEADLGELLASAEFEKLKKGAVLFHEGDTDSLNIYLLSGRIALLADKREMDLIDARDDTARFPLAHQLPRKFTAVARTKVEVVRIDNRRLGELIARSSQPDYEVSAVDGDTPDDWMSQLLQLGVFQQLPPANIQRVIMGMEEQSLDAGEELFRQGDEGDYFYLINKGQCRIVRQSDDGEEELARLGPGDCFGDESLLSGRPRAGTAVMLTEGVVVRLEKQRFLDNVVGPLFHDLSFEDAASRVEEGALWLDVRAPSAFENHHLPASLNLPLPSLRYQASSLDPERHYLVCGDDQGDRLVAAYLLMGQGFEVSLLREEIPGEEAEEGAPESSPVSRGGEVVDLQGEPVEQPAGDDREPLQQRLNRAEALVRRQYQRLEALSGELEATREQLRELERGGQEHEAVARRLAAALEQNADMERLLEEQAAKIKGLTAERETAEACLADLEQTIEELQGQLGEGRRQNDELQRLQRELEQAEAHRNASAETAERLRQEQEELKRGLTDAEARSAELERRLIEAEQAAERHEQTLRETRDSLEQAHRQTQQTERARDEAQAELASLGDRLQRTDEELAELRQRQRSLEGEREAAVRELADANGRIEELEQALARREQMAQEADEQARELRERLAEQEAELARHAGLAEQLEAAERRVAELESRLADGEQTSGALQEELERLRQRQRELEQQVERLGDEKGEADRARQAVEEQRLALETELRQSEERLAQLRREQEDERRRIADLEEERDRLTAELQAANQRLTTLEVEQSAREQSGAVELSALRERLEQADDALAEAQREREVAQRRLAGLEAESAARAEELERQRRRLADLEQQLEGLRGTESEELAALRERLDGAEQAREEVEAQRRELEQRLQRLETEKESLAAELTAAREAADRRIAELEAEREQWQQQREELTETRDQAQQQVAELERRLDAARSDEEEARSGQQQLIEHLQQELATQKERVDEAGHALIELELRKGRAEEELQTLSQRLQERELELAEQSRALSEARAALARGQGAEDELEQLRAELEEMRQAREAAERALEERRADAGGDQRGDGDIKGLKAEIKTLTDALEESDRSYEEMAARVRELEADLAAGGGAGDDAELLYEKQAAEQEVERLRAEVEALRATMEQYVHQIQAAREAGQDETAEALRTELALVREQAETDLAGMRDELEGLRTELEEKRLAESADASENQALKQEIENLQAELERQRQETDEARSGQHRLLEDVELQRGEISRLKEALEIATVEAEEAEFKRKEEIEARRQLEENLLQMQQEMGESRARELLQGSAFDAADQRGGGRGRGLLHALAGALLAFAVAEGLSIAAGGGELVTGLLRQTTAVAVPTADEAPDRADPAADRAASEVDEVPVDPAGAATPAPAAAPPGPTAAAAPAPVKPGKPIRDRLDNGLRAPAMMPIPGGTWTMGSERDPLAVEERPAHEVTLKPFAIGRTEVTFDQYDAFARDTGRRLPDDNGWGRGKRPVIDVTWNDAQAYARWLSRRTGQRYRLPTEAEWEYAAAGGSADYFWWGYEPGEGRANCFNCGSKWDGRSTAPVDAFAPNPYGLISTAGNVMEWVEDCYHPSYQGAPDDGSAWIEPGCSERSVRGGAYSKPAATLRTTYRSHFGQKARLPMLGFRLVRELR